MLSSCFEKKLDTNFQKQEKLRFLRDDVDENLSTFFANTQAQNKGGARGGLRKLPVGGNFGLLSEEIL